MKNDYKKDVDFVFKQHPELAKIGDEKDYSEYIKTIFPKSKVKNICYHQTPRSFENFNLNKSHSGEGVYFSPYNSRTPLIGRLIMFPIDRSLRNYTIPVLLDIEKPLKITKKENKKLASRIQNVGRLSKKVDLSKYDGVIGFSNTFYDKGQLDSDIINLNSKKDNAIEVVSLQPSKIHILGSKEDIQKFKGYMKYGGYRVENNSSLEGRILPAFFILLFILGLFFSLPKLTGNAIGISQNNSKFIGIGLMLLGALGFFMYNKLK